MNGVLVIVPCGKRKVWEVDESRGPTRAAEVYVGSPFKVNREYAERFADRWVILSAKYGFIDPDFIIPCTYNVTFKDKRTRPVSLQILREQIGSHRLDQYPLLIGLGGKDYQHIIAEAFRDVPVQTVFPFAGLPIGHAMHAAKSATSLP